MVVNARRQYSSSLLNRLAELSELGGQTAPERVLEAPRQSYQAFLDSLHTQKEPEHTLTRMDTMRTVEERETPENREKLHQYQSQNTRSTQEAARMTAAGEALKNAEKKHGFVLSGDAKMKFINEQSQNPNAFNIVKDLDKALTKQEKTMQSNLLNENRTAGQDVNALNQMAGSVRVGGVTVHLTSRKAQEIRKSVLGAKASQWEAPLLNPKETFAQKVQQSEQDKGVAATTVIRRNAGTGLE